MNKRGQFYLIAAVVIVGIIIGFATLTNFYRGSNLQEEKVYFLSNELDTESAYVIEYSVFNNKDTSNLLQTFSENYAKYAGEGRDIYFVFGNKDKIVIASLEEVVEGSVGFSGGTSIVQDIFGTEFHVDEYTPSDTGATANKVSFVINQGGEDVEYSFDLKPGENFYFVISEDTGSGRIVADGPQEGRGRGRNDE